MQSADMHTEAFEFSLIPKKMATTDLALSLSGAGFSFGSVREETLLSSWPAPNWVIDGNRIRQLRSRAEEREIRRRRMLAECGEIDPYVLIQNPPVPTLAFGDWGWTSYIVETCFSGGNDGVTGVAVLYQDARHYYAAMVLPDGKGRLVLRDEDDVKVLDQAPLEKRDRYTVRIDVSAGKIKADFAGGPGLGVSGTAYSRGKCAFVCEGISEFGVVEVRGRRLLVEDSSLPKAPEMELLVEGALGKMHTRGRVVVVDVDGDGLPELLSDDDFGNVLSCQHLRHGRVWSLGPFEHPVSRGGDIPLASFDIDGDGRREIVFAADFGIHVHDAATGEHKASVNSPIANPYRENADYPHELLLADALCPMRVLPGEPPGFYVKDRYWNIWVYDHRLNPLWHRALNTGHFPLPIRFDDDPRDYLFAGRTMLSPDGEVVWSLGLPDHSDAVGFFALNDKPRLYVAAGEEGLLELEPRTGEICTQLKYGHVQQYSVGRFSKERSEYQLLATTLWREPGICYVLDKKLDLIGRWREMATDLANYPVPWGTDGRDLIVDSGGIRDPFTGELLRPLPDRIGRVRKLAVLDLPKYGPGYLFVINEEQWQLWGAGSNVPAREPRNRPNALVPTSYLPILDL